MWSFMTGGQSLTSGSTSIAYLNVKSVKSNDKYRDQYQNSFKSGLIINSLECIVHEQEMVISLMSYH